MLLLAIDPGTTESAFVWYDTAARERESCGKVDNEKLLASIRESGRRRQDSHMAIEMVESFGMPVGREVFRTVVWIGRFEEAWGGPFTEVSRRQVKLHLCQSSRAKDGNVRQALIDKLGPQGTKKAPGPTYGISGDVWSALAVAVTWAETSTPPVL